MGTTTKTKILKITKKKGLTPLEAGERRIIESYLSKNDYMLQPTARELGIALNTLKAKIRQYKIKRLKLWGWQNQRAAAKRARR